MLVLFLGFCSVFYTMHVMGYINMADMLLLERLERSGTKVYNTGINNNILIASDGKQLQVTLVKDRPAQK